MNPKRPKTPYERFVQQAGLAISVFILLMAIGDMYFLMSPLSDISDIARAFLAGSMLVLTLVGGVMLAIFSE